MKMLKMMRCMQAAQAHGHDPHTGAIAAKLPPRRFGVAEMLLMLMPGQVLAQCAVDHSFWQKVHSPALLQSTKTLVTLPCTHPHSAPNPCPLLPQQDWTMRMSCRAKKYDHIPLTTHLI